MHPNMAEALFFLAPILEAIRSKGNLSNYE
jgi:hypothetical protein